MAITDSYNLQPSPPITLNGHEEATSNFQLQASPPTSEGNISGTVRHPDGTAIPFATVKLFDANGVPFEHTNSNPAGQFIFPRIPVGSYFITASEPTFLIPNRLSVTVLANRTTTVPITMQVDPNAARNAIFGIVRTSTNNQPIEDVTVELFRITGNTTEMIGIVDTNAQGQYLFTELENGNYFITVSKPGFLSNGSPQVAVADRDFAPIDIILVEDPDANTGTISGIITDGSTGSALPNATVALYSITNGIESIIDITKTTTGGLYLFGDLPPGTYRVKATVQVQV
ncbi:carboxypeptidase-like regulatory domain-containing protein [Bacillus gobiensis]|uniref:MSCRAMM family protein n=1 Tax=Bacillus gobiensis TaxID=1441095 RepID=UPI003D1E179D